MTGFVQTTCWKCKTAFYLPQALHDAARCSPTISFWCPFGHSAHFPEGETEETRLRRERDRLRQNEARLLDEKHAAETRAMKAEASTRRLKKRVAAGVCPCCHRTVGQMQKHMATKHPEYGADNVVKLARPA